MASVSLVVISALHLTQTALVTFCKGHLSQAHSCQVLTFPAKVLLVSSLFPVLEACLGLPGVRLVVIPRSLFAGNVRLPIILSFIGPNTKHRLSPLCHRLMYL